MKMLERIFFRRPRILNVLHEMRLAGATSQTNELELAALTHYAKSARTAVEIGSYQGVSAARIAVTLASNGTLYCVDPWPGGRGGRDDPNHLIFCRHMRRTRCEKRVQVLRGFSQEMAAEMPNEIDFAFIDGDHSWSGIETDWNLISPRVIRGGVVCLHDTAIPAEEPWRIFDSVRFYEENIATDPTFEAVETVYSLRVVRKMRAP